VDTLKTLSPEPGSQRIRISSNRGTLLRRSRFFCLWFFAGILALAATSGTPAFAGTPASIPAASAASVIGKNIALNGTPMPAGATLFPGDVIRLGESSSAALQFGNSLVLAAAETEFVVESGGVNLQGGFLQVRAGGAEPFAVSGPFFRVHMAASGGIPSSTEIHLGGWHAQVSAVAGTADLTSAGNPEPVRLHAGETASLDAGGGEAPAAQAASNPVAGQVSRLVPQVQIDRASQHVLASVSDRVYWNDGLRSGPTGRANVTLKDGSQLNLGSDSSLRIVQHDAQAQQTSLDLLVGRLRGKITKVNRPGAKFEIHTPLGIADMLGTDFSLLVADDYVELIVIEGSVRFTSSNGQAVTVSSRNKLRIPKAGAFEAPSPVTPQEVQTAESLTDITGTANQPAAAAVRSTVPLVITLTGVAAAVGIGVWQGTRPTVSVSIP
jgi:ferric-dicitrate binding protein FerR (iron transport regulator)